MAEFTPDIRTDIIVSFQESIRNIQRFAQEMEGLDARFGALEQRLDALRSSFLALSSAAATALRGPNTNLMQNINRQLENIIFQSIGNRGITISGDTVNKLVGSVETKLNEYIRDIANNISLRVSGKEDLDGNIKIPKHELDNLNEQIARLIRTQIHNFNRALQKMGVSALSQDSLKNVNLVLEQETIKAIVRKVKEHVIPVITNPDVRTEGVTLTITRQDLMPVIRRVKEKIKESIVQDSFVNVNDNRVDSSIRGMVQAVDKVLTDYVAGIVRGINDSPTRIEIPISSLDRRLKQAIAQELNATVEEVEKQLRTIGLYDATKIRVREEFRRVVEALSKKINYGIHEEVEEILKAINSVEISYGPQLKHYLINQINRINNAIVRKIREQVDKQFDAMLAEINAIETEAKALRRERRIARMAREAASADVKSAREAQRKVEALNERRIFGSDPYARRDAYFNTFGLQGAIINTIRHILAGTIVGTPIAAMYQAFEVLKSNQLELLKMIQNLQMKPEYQEGGRIDFARAERDALRNVEFARELARTYAIPYVDMMKVATIGSRRLETTEEIAKFIDIVGKTALLDPDADPVEQIAPGIEAIQAQFGRSIFELEEEFVKPIAVLTNVTKVTAGELIEALKRSGSTFNAMGVSPQDAAILAAIALQNTGLSPSDIGNFWKSINVRLSGPEITKILEQLGVKLYEERVVNGITVRMSRPTTEILADLGQLWPHIDDYTRRRIISQLAGTYQAGKFGATLPSFLLGETEEEKMENASKIFVQYSEIKKQMEQLQDDELKRILAQSATSFYANRQRVVADMQIEFEAVMQELMPAINRLANVMINLSRTVADNSDTIGSLIGTLANMGVGLLAWRGLRAATERMQIGREIELVEQRKTAYARMNQLNTVSPAMADVFAGILGDRRQAMRILDRGLRDERIAPYLETLAKMSGDDISKFNEYLEKTKTTIRDFPEFLMVLDEWNRNVKNAVDDLGSVQRFRNNLISIVSDEKLSSLFTDRFRTAIMQANIEKLYRTPYGREFMDNLASLSDRQITQLKNKLREMQRDTTINTFRDFSDRVNSVIVSLREAGEEARRSSNDYAALSNAFSEIVNRGNALNRTLTDVAENLNRLPSIIQGVTAAVFGLAKSLTGLAGQMVMFTGLGDIITSLSEKAIMTEAQRENVRVMEEERGLRSVLNTFGDNTLFGGAFLGFRSAYQSLLEIVTGGAVDKNLDLVSVYRYAKQITDTMNELAREYGIGKRYSLLDVLAFGGINKFIEDVRKIPDRQDFNRDDLFAEVAKRTGLDQRKFEAQEKLFDEENKMREYFESEKFKKAEQEGIEEARRARDLLNQGYLSLGEDAEEIRKRIRERIDEIKMESEARILERIVNGMKTNTYEYLELRRQEMNRMVELYNEEIRKIAQINNTLEQIVKQDPGYDPKKSLEEQQLQNQQSITALLQLQNNKKILMELEKERNEIIVEGRREQYRGRVRIIEDQIAMAEKRAMSRSLTGRINLDRTSPAYFDYEIRNQIQLIAELRRQLSALRSIPSNLDIDGEHAQRILDLENRIKQEQEKLKDLRISRVRAIIDQVDMQIRWHTIRSEIELLNAYIRGLARDSAEFVKKQREMYRQQLAVLNAEIKYLQSLRLSGEAAKLRDQDVREKLLEAKRLEAAIRETYMQEIEAMINRYRKNLEATFTNLEIEYLRKRLSTGLDDDSPLLRRLRINQMNIEVANLNKTIAALRTQLSRFKVGSEEYQRIQEEIRNLTRESLQVQISILEEMKNMGGTFNLPEGIKPMTYYEYLTRNNTHTTYTVQRGDVMVNIVLPNVRGNTPSYDLYRIGEQIGRGILNGSMSKGNLRNQVRGGPNTRVF